MLKAYKYRIYPNNEQKIQIAKTFGCCRFVYNQTLAYRKEVYEKEKKSVSKTDCNNYCNRQLKKEYEWLKEVDKFALTNAIYNMDAAYQKFFKEHAGYPKFKSKHDNHKSYTTNFTNGNITVDFGCNRVKLPKLKGIKAKLHRNFIGQIKSATISQVPSGKYYVSILVETEHVELPHINQNTGIDLGIKELCITSAGKKYENPKIIRKYEKKLVKLQRQLAHKEKRSQNYCKTKKKIALCHEKITNTRKDYLHKMSHEIISENQVIVSEDLQIKNMVKNHRLAKSIAKVKAGDTISLDHDVRLKIETVKDADEKEWIGVFTSSEEMHKGSAGNVQMNQSIESILRLALNWEQVNGIVINPFGKYIQMTKKMIELLINGYEYYENERKSKDDENN